MSFEVTILGANSAIPTAYKFPTSQLVSVNQSYYLIDCGEGVQMQLRKYKIKMQRINCIFISHLHGDHYFGIFGILNTMHLLGRQKDLHVFAPEELWPIIKMTLDSAHTKLSYKLVFHGLKSKKSEKIFSDEYIDVYTIPLKHRIYCNGFLIKEKAKKPKLDKVKLTQLNVPLSWYPRIKNGETYVDEDGSEFTPEMLTFVPPKPRSYAFCSDTAYYPSIIPIIEGANLLYHEATFTQDFKDRAKSTFHSTAQQAAQIAKEAGVDELIIGHFSARYYTADEHLAEAEPIFKNTKAAKEGKVFKISVPE